MTGYDGYIFPFFFVGIFVLAMYVLSKRGWSDLVSRYPFYGVFQGVRIGITSAGINGLSYNNCLVLRFNEQGFYLKTILVFRLFHKPIFIPWGEIKDIRDKDILFIQLKELVIGNPAIAIIQLRNKDFEKIGQGVSIPEQR